MDDQAHPISLDCGLFSIERLIASDTTRASVRKAAEDLLSVTRTAWLLDHGCDDGRS
jgi:hypothetical protein